MAMREGMRQDGKTLSGCSALVIGASGGIGYHVSVELAAHGAELIAHGRSREKLGALEREVNENGSRCIPVVQTLDAAEDVVPVLETAGAVDIVVISYGPFLEKQTLQTEAADWRRLYEHNVVMPSLLLSRVLPGMVERDYGRVVAFGGTGTHRVDGYRRVAAYSAAKTALGVLIKSTARETAGANIAVNALCPGPVDTEYLSEEQRQRFRRLTPSKSLLRPREVARHVLSLITQVDPTINGAVVPVDSGMT